MDNPNVVALVLPAIFAAIVLIVVNVSLRRESFALRVAISSICGVVTYILLVVLLISLGVQPQ
jgi:hypothetical protein